MIGKLRGVLDSVHDGGLILDVNGVGYLLSASARAVAALPAPPETGTLWVETVVREDAITLFGFGDEAERDWFRLLTSIQGVGPKVALGLLSVLSPAELSTALQGGDRVALAKAPGVGPKLAIRLLSELKDRARTMSVGTGLAAIAMPMVRVAGVGEDAVSALQNLGWKRPEAAAAVARVQERLGPEANLNLLIRESLKEMAPR